MALIAPAALASDDAARAVVERGIKMQGGVIKLAPRVMRLAGTINQRPAQIDRPVTIVKTWRTTGEYTSEIRVEIRGKPLVHYHMLAGESGWVRADGELRPMGTQVLAEALAYEQAEDLERLDFLSDTDCQVTSIPDTKVDGRDAGGVLVQPKGRREVKLYFDKETGLLVKHEHTMLDSVTGKPITQETLFGDYRLQANGGWEYMRLTIIRDGRRFLDAKVIERSDRPDARPEKEMGDWPRPEKEMGDWPRRARAASS
jgi:hypothetical protein